MKNSVKGYNHFFALGEAMRRSSLALARLNWQSKPNGAKLRKLRGLYASQSARMAGILAGNI